MEFKCNCNRCEFDEKNMDRSFVLMIRKVEDSLPFNLTLTSSIRCPYHNDITMKASTTSSHKTGKAADISAKNSRERFLIIEACIEAGFNRIGIGKTFIHIDSDINKDPDVIWLY